MFGKLELLKNPLSDLKTVKIPFSDPYELYFRFYNNFGTSYLLESRCGNRNIARFSFLGFDPQSTVSFREKRGEIKGEYIDSFKDCVSPLKIIQNLVGDVKTKVPFPLVGGGVGYISYDAVNYWEKIPYIKRDDFNFPDIEMGIYDDGFVFDPLSHKAFYYYSTENRLKELLSSEIFSEEEFTYTEPKSNTTKNAFENNVKKAKEYIYSGDIFQIVISKRFEFELKGDPLRFYLSLRKLNPSPYMFFCKFGRRKIIGSSPEMLVRINNRIIETNPIADGPTIQQASYRGIESGATPIKILKIIRKIKRQIRIPTVLLTYYNPIFKMGLKKFFEIAEKSEVDGLVIPDLPVDEASEYVTEAENHNIATIFLAAPTTPPERLETIVENCSGFLYMISLLGVTGAKKQLDPITYEAVKKTLNFTKNKIYLSVGFGISKPEHVKSIIQLGADGVIVGSGIIKIIEKNITNSEKMYDGVKKLTVALKQATKNFTENE